VQLPFGPDSRTGYELELLAPRGKSRLDLALALADRVGGRVRYGLKYQSEGRHGDGRPVCDLSPAFAVVDGEGVVLCTLVDDVTLKAELDKEAPTATGYYRVVIDELRLALWAESRCWSDEAGADAVLAGYAETFAGTLGEAGGEGAKHAEHRVLLDRWGHALAVVATYPGERERACEVVTRPLARGEREAVVGTILEVAKALDFGLPEESALHLHLDADPWRAQARLRQLVQDYSAARHVLYEELRPNPGAKRLGPFRPSVVRAAATPADDDESYREALLSAGVTKYSDINLLGIVRRRPRQPTLEFRCLRMSMDASEIFEMTDAVEGFLLEVARAADARAERES
jgi:hypothetical protein